MLRHNSGSQTSVTLYQSRLADDDDSGMSGYDDRMPMNGRDESCRGADSRIPHCKATACWMISLDACCPVDTAYSKFQDIRKVVNPLKRFSRNSPQIVIRISVDQAASP